MKQRKQMIDLMRIVFSIVIFCNHLNHIAQASESINIIMRFEYLGVEFFFIVSGYLMASSALKYNRMNAGNATLRFCLRKWIIILPYYLVAWLIGFIVAHYAPPYSFQQIFKDLLLSVPAILQLGIAGFPAYQVLGPTWYISAMLFSMLVLFPMLLLWKDNFSFIIAPIVIIMFYGYLLKNVGSLATIDPLENGIVYTGLLRGMAGISLGCLCFKGAQFLASQNLSSSCKALLTAAEIICYCGAVLGMCTQYVMRPDFFVVILLAVGVTLTFSGQSNIGRMDLSIPNFNWGGQPGNLFGRRAGKEFGVSTSSQLCPSPTDTALHFYIDWFRSCRFCIGRYFEKIYKPALVKLAREAG